jgi:putative ATPase
MAINDALALVKETGDLPVPLNIRNAPTSIMKELGYGTDYKYAHDYEGNFTREEFMPAEIRNKMLYNPQENQREAELRKKLSVMWKDKYNY